MNFHQTIYNGRPGKNKQTIDFDWEIKGIDHLKA